MAMSVYPNGEGMNFAHDLDNPVVANANQSGIELCRVTDPPSGQKNVLVAASYTCDVGGATARLVSGDGNTIHGLCLGGRDKDWSFGTGIPLGAYVRLVVDNGGSAQHMAGSITVQRVYDAIS